MASDRGTVIVTGDAGAIGAATAGLFLDSGWSVLGLDKAGGGAARSEGSYRSVDVDVTDEEAVTRELRSLDEMPPLRHVIAIAGGALETEPTTQHDPTLVGLDDFRASLEINLTSQFVTLKSALPRLQASAEIDRSVTLTSSFNALSAQGMPAYSAAKAGLIGMMNALVSPLGASGIRINTVAPGTIRTPRTERIWSHAPDHFERLGKSAALGRVGEPNDVAMVFRSVALEMTHMTGQVLVVDGGQLQRPL